MDALPGGRVYALLTEEIPPLLLTVNVDYFAVWVIATVAIAELLKNIFYEAIILGGVVKLNPHMVVTGVVGDGVSDNLEWRSVLDRNIFQGNIWSGLKRAGLENVCEVMFIVVNAETDVDDKWDHFESIPPLAAMLKSISRTAIELYNVETLALLQESFARWTQEIYLKRCPPRQISTNPGSCGEVCFYFVEVKFGALEDEAERQYLNRLPTSFHLQSGDVDRLRKAAHQMPKNSSEFKQILNDLQN